MTRLPLSRRPLLLALLVTLQPLALQATVDERPRGLHLLEKHQLGAHNEGLTKALRWLHGEDTPPERLTALVEQLAHSEFNKREDATEKLSTLGMVPGMLLEEAKHSKNPEISSRAKRIIEARVPLERDRPQIFLTIFERVSAGQAKVPFKQLLPSLPHLETIPLREAWVEALAASATNDETPWLLDALKNDNPVLRQAGIRGLPRANPKRAIESLTPLVENDDLRQALPAVHSLLELGERQHLKTLLKWTSSKDVDRRIGAVQLLRAATGQNFGLSAYLEPEAAQEARKAWAEWLNKEGKLARQGEPKFQPLVLESLMEDLERGLLTHYRMNEVADGKLLDLSEHKRDGTLRGKYELVAGPVDQAIRLEGKGVTGLQGGHAELPFLDFNTMKEFSLTLWVNQESLTWEHGEAFICYGFDQGATFKGSLCIGSFFDHIHFRVGSGKVMIPQPKEDLKRWMHYAMTYRDGELRVFRNGKLAATKELAVDVKGNQAALGRHWWSNGFQTSTRFVGALDEIRVYGRSLTDEQIHRLYQHQGGQ